MTMTTSDFDYDRLRLWFGNDVADVLFGVISCFNSHDGSYLTRVVAVGAVQQVGWYQISPAHSI
jgi:hypothetical protein